MIAVVLLIPEFSLSLVVAGDLNRRKRRGVAMFALWKKTHKKTNKNKRDQTRESSRGVSALEPSIKWRLSVSKRVTFVSKRLHDLQLDVALCSAHEPTTH